MALSVTENDPAEVGEPDTVPPGESSKPGGRPPLKIVNVYGSVPPLAVNVCTYGAPTMPFGKLPRIEIAGQATLPASGIVR